MLFCEPCDHFRGAHGLLLDSQVVNAIGLIFGQELVRDLENSVMGSGAILGGLYREPHILAPNYVYCSNAALHGMRSHILASILSARKIM